MNRGSKQKRLRHYTDAPRRLLRRARDFYVDTLVNFDGKVATATVTARPKDFGGRFSAKTDHGKDVEEVWESMRRNYAWKRVEERGNVEGSYRVMERSYSVALGKIGRIDEEQECEFEEDVVIKTEILFPRCRSFAVKTTNAFY